MKKNSGYEYTTDLLVIGCGFSGMWAAMRAKDFLDDVLVVDKGPRDWGGLGGLSGGDMIVKQPDMNLDDLLDDLVYYYDGLADQKLLGQILTQSYDRFMDFENLGHKFVRNDKGELCFIPQRALDHMRYYYYHPYGMGGIEKARLLKQECEKRGVRRLGRTVITDVITDGERVTGAVGFHSQSGVPVFIKARAVLLATNTGGWKPSYHQNTPASEGVSIAWNAGCAMRNFEFWKVWNVPVDFAWEGQTGLLPKGARFLNAKGEDFMKKYSPKFGAKADPHYNTRGMVHEVRAGNGPIRFDCSQMKPEDVETMRPRAGWMGLNDKKLRELGIDFFGQKLEWMPQVRHTYGGIVADLDGSTAIKGLYAAGLARNPDPGVYMGGWDTCKTTTTGYIAGNSAGQYVSGLTSAPRFDDAHASDTLDATLSLLGKPGVYPKDVVRLMQELMAPMDVCILKTGKGLTRSLERLEDAKQNILPYMTAPEPHYLVKLVEARSMALITEMYLKASLMRKESRSGHYREDFPERHGDPAWIVIRSGRDGMDLRTDPVPLDRYPVKPHRYYMDNFAFPKTSAL